MGSGELVKKAISKYGISNFTKSFVCYADSIEELRTLEIFHIKNSWKQGKAEYNLSIAPPVYGQTLEQKMAISKRVIIQLESGNHPFQINRENAKKARKNLIEDVKLEVVEQYSKIGNIKKVALNMGLPTSVVKESLSTEKVNLNYRNKTGHPVSLETKINISDTLKSNFDYFEISCSQCGESQMVTERLSKIKRFCSKVCERRYKNQDLCPSKGDLWEMYWIEQLSLSEIGSLFGVSEEAAKKWLIKLDIPRRNRSEQQVRIGMIRRGEITPNLDRFTYLIESS